MRKVFAASLIIINVVYAQFLPSIDWLKIYNGPGSGIDMTNDAKIDGHYNLYLAGRSVGKDGTPDLLILKYSRTGELISEMRFISAPASWEEAKSIALDSSGNLYCIGDAAFGNSSPFTVIQKYSPNDSLLWSKNFYNTAERYSEGIKITVDENNNMIAGYQMNGACIGKYSSNGDSLWTIKIADDTSSFGINDIITDVDNNIYAAITQSYSGGSDVPYTFIHTYKIDGSGKIIWERIFKGNYAKKLVLDKENNIIQLIINDSNGVIIKISSSGKVIFEKDSGILVLTGLAIDGNNNIITAGYDIGNFDFDYFTRKYSPAGDEEWTKKFNSPENLKDYASAAAVDDSGNIYVTGSSHNSLTSEDSYTVKYSNDGKLLWSEKINAPHSTFIDSKFIFLDDSSNVLIGGDVADSLNGWNFFAMKIRQDKLTGVSPIKLSVPAKYLLEQNYPNPFNPVTAIRYSIPKSEFVSIIVYDILGNKIETLVNEFKAAGNYKTEFNGGRFSSGIYFYRMKAGGFAATKKMILIE